MGGEVSYLKADGKSMHKPYEYTFKDVKASKQQFIIPRNRSAGFTSYQGPPAKF